MREQINERENASDYRINRALDLIDCFN